MGGVWRGGGVGGRCRRVVLSADAGGQTLPLAAAPGVAVVLHMSVAVGQHGAVGHCWVVEALQRELWPILLGGMGGRETDEKEREK